MIKPKPKKQQCRSNLCMKHTSNNNRICNSCMDLITGKKKKEPGNYKYKKAKKKRSTYKIAEDSTWKEMSIAVRLRDTNNNGFGLCIATGKRIWYYKDQDGRIVSNCDAGHFISRRIKNIMFDLDNVHAQSRQSNRFHGEEKDLYRENLIIKIDTNRFKQLEKKSKLYAITKHRPNILELKELKKEFIGMQKELLKSKNWT